MLASEEDLIRRARQGDEQAFHEIVELYASPLYATAYSLLGNRPDAEDVVQETFLGAIKGIKNFQGRASLKTWLTRILVNQASHIRRKRIQTRASELTDETTSSRSSSADPKMDVTAMLTVLSEEHREVLVLRELEGFSYEEIAEALHVPVGTVESRLHRARQQLKTKFEGYF